MFWFRRKPKRLHVPPLGFSVDDFTGNAELASQAKQFFLGNPLGRAILSVLHNAQPRGYPMRGESIDPTTAAIELGRIQGHQDLMAVIYSMMEYRKPTSEIPITYGADEENENPSAEARD